MRRGDVHFVDFEPAIGSDANDRRPAVIVSNDASNAAVERFKRGVVTVVPLTSHLAQVYPFHVLLPASRTGLSRDSKAQAEQVRAVDVTRIGDRIGLVPYSLLAKLDDAIRIHLDLG